MSGPAYLVSLTADAEADLEAIFESLRTRASAAIAERLLDELLTAVETLESFPDRGVVPTELADLGIREFRQLVVQTYRLIYRAHEGAVTVMEIADGRQDMQCLLERRLLAP